MKDSKIHQSKSNKKILEFLETTGNVIILALIVALVIAMGYKLYTIFFIDFFQGEFSTFIDNMLLILIMMELFSLLYVYLLNHHIKVERVIELGIISIVREMLFKVHEFESGKIYAVSVLLVALGLIFFIERYWSNNRNGEK
ncbi:MAG TPA: phosphate-starvation-inducible PsiE family protein [Alphaproteobacteria bacterium]|nr:phosphate-starvation-inducible PsiE family protein [Alphaproteobacteria bacterium]